MSACEKCSARPRHRSSGDKMSRGVLLIISGSVAAANGAGLCRLLKDASGLLVTVVLSENAKRFVTRDALLCLGQAEEVLHRGACDQGRPTHIRLAEDSIGALVYPASAGFIGKIANGLALDLASTSLLACTGKPVLVVPSMNAAMWANPMVQRNLRLLSHSGLVICQTDEGLAPSVDKIAELFLQMIKPRSGFNAKGKTETDDRRKGDGASGGFRSQKEELQKSSGGAPFRL